jgi:hypothetical protein
LGLVVLFLFLLAAAVGTTSAQTISSTIIGTVADPGNAVIPDAKATLTNRATGTVRTGQSNEAGLLRFLDVPAGDYSLRIEAAGFKTQTVADIALASSETRDLGTLVMQIGAMTENVSVTAEATPVQTASSERSALIDSTQLNDVALKGRDVYGYMRLLPGVVDATASRDLSNAFAVQGVSINGQTSANKNVTFDGITILDSGGQNNTFVAPNLDAIAEVRVVTNAYQAEFGRASGGGINLITKNGTREFHGSGYWNRRHEDMNANTFFNNRSGVRRPLYRYFIGGYSVGGPIYIPKLVNTKRQRFFFFASQEFTRVKVPTSTSTANVPTQLERNGDFSNSLSSVGKLIPIIDPNTGAQFPGNVIPKSRIDPTGQAILNLFALPNGYVNPAPGQQYSANFLASATGYHNHRDDIVRLDGALTSKVNLFLRVGRDTDNATNLFTIAPTIPNGAINFVPGYAFTAHLTHTLSASMVNEVVFGLGHNNYGYYHMDADSNYFRTSSLNPPMLRSTPLPYCTETGNQSCPNSYKPYLPTFQFAGGSVVSPVSYTPSTTNGSFEVPYRNYNDNYTFQDNFSKVIGNHNVKVGLYLERETKSDANNGSQYAGVYNFGSNVNNPLDTGHGYANALLGIYQSYTESSKIPVPYTHYWIDEGYVQDNWRVSRRLNLDLGVRWYRAPSPHETNGAIITFFPQLWSSAQAPRIYWPATVGGKAVALDRATGATTYSSLVGTLIPGTGSPVNGIRVDGLNGDGNFYTYPALSFVPRVGIAWDLFGDGKTAMRASYGMFNNVLPSAGASLPSGPPAYYSSVIYYSYLSLVPQAAANAALAPTSGLVNQGQHQVEISNQLNLTIQRDIGFHTVLDFGYVMSNDRHAPQSLQINPIALRAYADPANIYNNTEVNANLLRTAYPGMAGVSLSSNSLSPLNYSALQVQAQHRLSHGIQFGVSYSFSKALGTQAWDAYHSQRAWNYGPLAQDRTHVLAVNYTYFLPPVGARLGFAKHILNDWVLSGVTVFQTGAPVTPACSSQSAGPANSDPSLSGGGARCQEVADPNNFQHSFYTNFNTSAFTLAPPGTFGNIGLGILRQPAWSNWDMNLEKRIRLGKDTRRQIRLRLEAYNVFNHAEFSSIGTTISLLGTTNTNTQTGQYTATMSPRQMSTTLRFEF